MIEVNAKITTQPAQQLLDGQTTSDSPPETTFSYALASTTLQSQAATSLKVHGAAPSEGATAGTSSQPPNTRNGTQDTVTSRQNETQLTNRDAAVTTNKPAAQASAVDVDRAQPSTTPANAQVTATPVGTVANTAPSQSAVQQVLTQPKETAALREAATSKEAARAQKLAQTTRTNPAQQPQQDFARLLARRLDTATSFEMRLDPPELGRVEGRFTVSDDGKSVLSLKFDNQSAFDLFAKDEAGLRTALTDAGVDLGDSGLAFTLAEHAPSTIASPSNAIETPLADMISYDPVFSAAFSSGAIDIRI